MLSPPEHHHQQQPVGSVDDVRLAAQLLANPSTPSNGHAGLRTPLGGSREALAGGYIPRSAPPSPRHHHPSPAINHVDFWPSTLTPGLRAGDANFEDFDAVFARASSWLQKFPQYEVIDIETTNKKVIYVKDVRRASMCFIDEDGPSMAVDVKGLRLWYKPSSDPECTGKGIGFVDFMPKYLNPGEKHPKFDLMPATLARFNSQLESHPIPGKVLSMETVAQKIAREDWSSSIKIESKSCRLFDEYNNHQVAFLRLYYLKGAPRHEVIGVRDFTPDTLDEGGIFHPAKYSPFSALIKKASTWIQKQATAMGVRVTNIQTLDTKHRRKSENKGHRFDTDKLFEYRIEERFRAFFLRVSYASIPEWELKSEIPPVWPRLSGKTFIPYKKGADYENILEMLPRVVSDMQKGGASVIHIETVAMPEWITKPELCEKGERTFYDGDWYFVPDKDGNDRGPYRYTIVYALRVYFDGGTDMFMRSMSVNQSGRKCCLLM